MLTAKTAVCQCVIICTKRAVPFHSVHMGKQGCTRWTTNGHLRTGHNYPSRYGGKLSALCCLDTSCCLHIQLSQHQSSRVFLISLSFDQRGRERHWHRIHLFVCQANHSFIHSFVHWEKPVYLFARIANDIARFRTGWLTVAKPADWHQWLVLASRRLYLFLVLSCQHICDAWSCMKRRVPFISSCPLKWTLFYLSRSQHIGIK